MTDIKVLINTTSDGTFLSGMWKPEKSVDGQKLGGGGLWPPQHPKNYPLLL